MSIADALKVVDLKEFEDRRKFGGRNVEGFSAPLPPVNLTNEEVKRYSVVFDQIAPRQWFWPNFTPEEVACKGTGLVPINYRPFIETMDALQALRTEMRAPFFLTSMYRSPAYNAHVGGARRSQHQQGRAVDISTFNLDRERLVRLAREIGFRGIGFYKTFIHLDTRNGRSTTWGRP